MSPLSPPVPAGRPTSPRPHRAVPQVPAGPCRAVPGHRRSSPGRPLRLSGPRRVSPIAPAPTGVAAAAAAPLPAAPGGTHRRLRPVPPPPPPLPDWRSARGRSRAGPCPAPPLRPPGGARPGAESRPLPRSVPPGRPRPAPASAGAARCRSRWRSLSRGCPVRPRRIPLGAVTDPLGSWVPPLDPAWKSPRTSSPPGPPPLGTPLPPGCPPMDSAPPGSPSPDPPWTPPP